MLQREEPWLVTSSAPCATFSPLRNISNPKRDPELAREEELGKERVRKSVSCCKQQADQGGAYLHERPKRSTSWDMPEVQAMLERPDTWLVTLPMCRFGMKMENPDGELLHVRKETKWMTNSECIAKELAGQCENLLAGGEVHRHTHLIGKSWP